MPGAALPGGAPVRPDLEGPGETPEVDERRWHLQGTIQSMPAPPSPAPPPPPPPREDEAPKISKWVEVQPELTEEPTSSLSRDQQQDFRKKMQAARQLAPELRTQRKELQEAVKAIEQKGDALRQSCAEAEREAREDFEMLRSHLNSVESLKQAVLNREKEVRLGLLQSIEEFQRALQADGGVNAEAVAAARAAYPDPYGAADALCSRASSLPQVEVPIDDIPFEARARSEKLRRHVISERLLKAKDLSLWRLEQQRRQLQAESQEAAQWLRHLGSMLDRYAEELGHICYFCAERFCAPAANTRCPWNLGASPRSGRHLSPDPRVPSALWGAGVHFWVPLPAASSQTAAAMAGFIPDARWEERSGQALAPVPPPPEFFPEVRESSSSRQPSPFRSGPMAPLAPTMPPGPSPSGPSAGPPPRRRDLQPGDLGDRGRPGWRDARTARLVDAGPLPPQARDERRAAFREEENFVGL